MSQVGALTNHLVLFSFVRAIAPPSVRPELKRTPRDACLYSSVAERQSCKLKVLGSIPSGGLFWIQIENLGRGFVAVPARKLIRPASALWPGAPVV